MISDGLSTRRWFDAHLDLAYLAECGRDMTAALEAGMGPHPPASVTLPALAAGGVTACLGTIFTEATDPGGPAKYPTTAYEAGDAAAAHEAGVRQLNHYERWRGMGLITRMPRRGGGQGGEGGHDEACSAIELGILIECADPIRDPGELSWWVERGVVAIGLSWWKSSRYAAGNGAEGGLTELGRELIREMDRLGVILDLSHLNQQATDEALSATDSPVIASHSNARALIDGVNQRHLADETIAEIGRRGGVIGLNLCAPFLVEGGAEATPATIDDCVRHIEHVCEVQGSPAGVGLGSDMDGGFSAERLPRGIASPADLEKIAEALSGQGWTDAQIAGFKSQNWRRFWAS